MGFEKLPEVVKRITSSFRVHAVALFGSRARGDYRPWSDYDILVIADSSEKYLDRIGRILELLGSVDVNIELHPYTLDEAIEMLRKGNSIIVDGLSEGIVLYCGEKFEELLNLYRELVRRGLRKSETSVAIPSNE